MFATRAVLIQLLNYRQLTKPQQLTTAIAVHCLREHYSMSCSPNSSALAKID